jgi:dethiobiotin synthetase/adenosylmethionine--8-amino-7-oxononanoate aminotransferase
VKICKSRGIPVVFDEIAVGMYRLGPSSTSSILGITPDIAAYGKLLTGGYLPLAVTLATDETFQCFHSSEKHQALLHGHSYTANPISCSAALEAIRQFSNSTKFDATRGAMSPSFVEADARRISLLPGVDSCVCLGSLLTADLANINDRRDISPEVQSVVPSVAVVKQLRLQGIYARPLGNTIYLMTSQITSRSETEKLLNILEQCIRKVFE